nr:MAG TPA: zinc-ribbon protein [Crassvirales sp.]
MAKKSPPPKIIWYPDCTKCINGIPHDSYNFLCPICKTYVPQPNCNVRKVMCIYFKAK